MLVIKRQAGNVDRDRIYLDTSDGRVEIILTWAGDGWAKIGIDAPQCIAVSRPDMKKGASENVRNANFVVRHADCEEQRSANEPQGSQGSCAQD